MALKELVLKVPEEHLVAVKDMLLTYIEEHIRNAHRTAAFATVKQQVDADIQAFKDANKEVK